MVGKTVPKYEHCTSMPHKDGPEAGVTKMFSTAYLQWGRWTGTIARQVGFVVFALLCVAGTQAQLQAQTNNQLIPFSRSYLTPFPEADRYRLYVFGDSLGDGIWAGLYRAFKPDGNVDVVKKSRVSTGFVRTDYFDWIARLRTIAKVEKFHIAVIMVGANDMQSIRHKGKRSKIGTEGWRDIYGERIDAFIKRLKQTHAAVYWVGLPVMRSEKHNVNMQLMNEIFREKAFINGVKFIDTWNGFADQFGRYSAFGPDLSGQVRRLRAEDGVHFTIKGYRKLAHFVEREIRRDMRNARAERNIPLAGDEQEQARALPRNRKRATPNTAPKATPARPARRTSDAPNRTQKKDETKQSGQSAAVSSPQDKKKKAAGLSILRPEMTAAAAVAASRSAGYAPEGETIAGEIGNGLTALASVSPINDPTLSSPQRLPLTQRPYYRVLIKGEQLKPKIGRADDFTWPRS